MKQVNLHGINLRDNMIASLLGKNSFFIKTTGDAGATTLIDYLGNLSDLTINNPTGVVVGDGFVDPIAATDVKESSAATRAIMNPENAGQIIISFGMQVASTTADTGAPYFFCYGTTVSGGGGYAVTFNDTTGNRTVQLVWRPEGGANESFIASANIFADTNFHTLTLDINLADKTVQWYLDKSTSGSQGTISDTTLADRAEGLTFLARNNNGTIDRKLGTSTMNPKITSVLFHKLTTPDPTLALKINNEMVEMPNEIPLSIL